MKKFILLALLSMSKVLYAQTNTFPTSGKVGIGTVTPTSQLQVVTPALSGGETLLKMKVDDAENDYLEVKNSTGGANSFIPLVLGNVVSTTNSALVLTGQTDSIHDTGSLPLMLFSSRMAGAKINTRPLFAWANYNVKHMTMLANGNLGIGIANPNEKLAVNGNIRAHEIKVETANWPDYVFAKGYELPSLKEIEAHIKEKGHLPGIPSAEEVKTNGVNLGEMNAKLLKKIEELTLHLVEQQKRNDLQAQTMQKMEARILNLEKKK
ncbi:hypothetical protein CPT03_16995 [Pedobacter ginsengisoli]|uniref:Cell wall anchor protein n=1 Tax=Pedobacter ginsengisoli TaxID=363852 RepID=A0A2D1U8Z8_9SPHI|nr:hypothetical protein [Pedobacter ginsengisoli]ATP58042.1 hypothetical protein CPT03_16995 [Pedobacter ginsengisoli]